MDIGQYPTNTYKQRGFPNKKKKKTKTQNPDKNCLIFVKSVTRNRDRKIAHHFGSDWTHWVIVGDKKEDERNIRQMLMNLKQDSMTSVSVWIRVKICSDETEKYQKLTT